MKKHNKNNKLNTIWWSLFIAGILSASASQKLVYNIAYKMAYDKAWSETLHRGIKEKGYNVGLGPDYCTDFDLLDEAKETASQIASQKARNTADRTLDAGAFMAVAGLIGLLAKKNGK